LILLKRMHPLVKHQGPIENSSYITGAGTINCTGIGPDTLWDSVRLGTSFIKNGVGRMSDEALLSIKSELLQSPFKHWVSDLYKDLRINKFYICSLFAIHQAFQQSGWDRLDSSDCLLLATTSAQIPAWETELADYSLGNIHLDGLMNTFWQEPFGNVLRKLMDFMGVRCQGYVISSACNASTQAIHLANLFLRENKFKRCLVGGTEVLSEFVLNGFKSLQVLSETLATPFRRQRKGINLSEGSAFLCMEKTPKETPLAALVGGSFVSESFHMTSPDPEGKGYFQAMSSALEDSGLSSGEISWIHAHGTGSPQNDLAEASAIERLFAKDPPWVSSTKAIHGHMLGASGILESIICLQSLNKNEIPQNAGDGEIDPQIRIPISGSPIPNQNRYVMKNTAGFGGNNSSLIFSRI
jgi:3-oxoacyl-(acyl-carrier-protein) synthase